MVSSMNPEMSAPTPPSASVPQGDRSPWGGPATTEPTILLTGFEPFGGEVINPSWEVARGLDGERIAGARVIEHWDTASKGELPASMQSPSP